MKIVSRPRLALLLPATLLPATLAAQDFVFAPSSGEWYSPSNWQIRTPVFVGDFEFSHYTYASTFNAPDAGQAAFINNGRTAVFTGPGSSGTAFALYLGERDNFTGVATSGHLNMSGGSLSGYDAIIAHGSTAVVSGGTWFLHDDDTPRNSSLHLYNGTLDLTGTGALRIGFNSAGTLYMTPQSAYGGVATLNIGTGGAAGTLYAARINGDSSATVNFNHTGSLVQNTMLTGFIAVTKSGSGTTTLTGSASIDYGSGIIITGNDYTGGTTVNAGVLIAGSDTAFGTGDVVLNGGAVELGGRTLVNNFTVNGGTLKGVGTIGSLTVQSGGTFAPGNSPGLVTVDGDLTLDSGGTTELEIGGTTRGSGYDAVNISGALNAGGTLTVSFFGGYTLSGPATFDFFNFTSFGGSFAQVNLPTVLGYTWNTSQLSVDGSVSLIASAIPEPASFAVLAGFGALGLATRRRALRS